jgi:hypothetical protein
MVNTFVSEGGRVAVAQPALPVAVATTVTLGGTKVTVPPKQEDWEVAVGESVGKDVGDGVHVTMGVIGVAEGGGGRVGMGVSLTQIPVGVGDGVLVKEGVLVAVLVYDAVSVPVEVGVAEGVGEGVNVLGTVAGAN